MYDFGLVMMAAFAVAYYRLGRIEHEPWHEALKQSLGGRKINLRLRHCPLTDVLEAVMREAGLSCEISEERAVIRTAEGKTLVSLAVGDEGVKQPGNSSREGGQ